MDQLRLFGMKAEQGRWLLILTGMLINLCLGSIYSWSVFVVPLSNYFSNELGQQISPTGILLPFSVFLASFALAMPPAGRLIETWGPRKTTLLGGILTGCGWLLAPVTIPAGAMASSFLRTVPALLPDRRWLVMSEMQLAHILMFSQSSPCLL